MDVLLVEDEPALLDAMLEGLAAALPGLRVAGAPSAELAGQLVARHGVPALLISDLRLPGKSGVELAEQLRRARHDLAVLLISAVPEPVPEHLTGGVGRTGVLRKPFNLKDLVTAVRQALDVTDP